MGLLGLLAVLMRNIFYISYNPYNPTLITLSLSLYIYIYRFIELLPWLLIPPSNNPNSPNGPSSPNSPGQAIWVNNITPRVKVDIPTLFARLKVEEMRDMNLARKMAKKG